MGVSRHRRSGSWPRQPTPADPTQPRPGSGSMANADGNGRPASRVEGSGPGVPGGGRRRTGRVDRVPLRSAGIDARASRATSCPGWPGLRPGGGAPGRRRPRRRWMPMFGRSPAVSRGGDPPPNRRPTLRWPGSYHLFDPLAWPTEARQRLVTPACSIPPVRLRLAGCMARTPPEGASDTRAFGCNTE